MAALHDEKYKSSQIVNEQEGKLCAGKQTANILIRQYAETSDLQVPTDRKSKIRVEQLAGFGHQKESMMNSSFATKEPEDALTTLKFKRVPPVPTT